MKKKKPISEEQYYLCEIGLEEMHYRSSWLFKSYTEETSRTSRLRPIIMWTKRFFRLPPQHGEIYEIAVPHFANWCPPSIWKVI